MKYYTLPKKSRMWSYKLTLFGGRSRNFHLSIQSDMSIPRFSEKEVTFDENDIISVKGTNYEHLMSNNSLLFRLPKNNKGIDAIIVSKDDLSVIEK